MKSTAQPPAVAVCIDTRDGAGRSRLHGVAQYLRRLGWRMLLVRHTGRAAAAEVARLRPDGVIAYIADRWLLAATRAQKIPLVDTAFGELAVPMTVSLDNDAVARLAVEHFTQAGLKHIAYCGVKRRLASEQRRASLATALGGKKLAAFADAVSEGESDLEPLVRWLKQLPKPVGVLVFDDKLGERVLAACHAARLAIPQQVAVLGIGNDELMCDVSWPTLSSVSFPTPRLGYEAAHLLAQKLAGKKIQQPHRKIQPTSVVARGSTDLVSVEDALVKDAAGFIRAQAGGLIGVKHVAQALGISRRTLDRRFAGALGRTARDELLRVRMNLARTLLADPARSIATMASECGYSTAASFSRAFRQHAGHWPSAYRAHTRGV